MCVTRKTTRAVGVAGFSKKKSSHTNTHTQTHTRIHIRTHLLNALTCLLPICLHAHTHSHMCPLTQYKPCIGRCLTRGFRKERSPESQPVKRDAPLLASHEGGAPQTCLALGWHRSTHNVNIAKLMFRYEWIWFLKRINT